MPLQYNVTNKGGVVMKFSLGLDVHKQATTYALVDEKGSVQERGSIKTDPRLVLELFSWLPKNEVIIGMESSTYIYPLYDAFNNDGYRVKVANPIRLRRITKSAVKNDDKDALDIALQLLRNDFPESHMLSIDMRDKRELIRQHIRLTQEQTRIKNRIYAHLARHNHRMPCKLGTKKGTAFLDKVDLPVCAKLTLRQMSTELQRKKEQLREIKAEIHKLVKNSEDMKKLMTIDGVGEFTAATFCLELGDWRRFKTAKELTGYVGLTPTMLGSSKRMYYGRMRFDGNHQIKYACTRAAEIAIRKENVFQMFFKKLMAKGKERKEELQ